MNARTNEVTQKPRAGSTLVKKRGWCTSAEGSSPLAETNAGGGSVKRAGGKDIFEGEGGEKGHLKMLETYSSSGARVDA